MLLPCLVIGPSEKGGRGVFTTEPLSIGTTVEISPVIVLAHSDREHVEKTLLYNYIFEWGTDRSKAAVGLGYLSMYNHSVPSNCEYLMDYEACTMHVTAVGNILAGEELTINYNGDFDDPSALWFPTR